MLTERPQPGRLVVALFTDIHSGNALGLLSPDTRLPNPSTGDYEPVTLNPAQRMLWEWFAGDVQGVIDFAAGDPLMVVHVGDPTQGTRFASELVSTRIADHILIAVENFQPWYGYTGLRAVRLIVGTGVHEFNEATGSIMVGEQLRRMHPHIGVRVLYHHELDAGGVTFDLSHHGPGPGSRNWLRGNNLRYYVRDIMTTKLKGGHRPPDVVARGHYHTYTSEIVTDYTPERIYETRADILPSYCWMNEHGRKATKSESYIGFGMKAYEIVGGKLTGHKLFYRAVDMRSKERWNG